MSEGISHVARSVIHLKVIEFLDIVLMYSTALNNSIPAGTTNLVSSLGQFLP